MGTNKSAVSSAFGTYRIGATVFPFGRMPYDIASWMKKLRSFGWTTERLAKNELPVEYLGEHFLPYSHDEFWHTIREMRMTLKATDIPPIFIKCIRSYPYFDSNVDLVVNPSKAVEAIDALCAAHWTRPTGASRIEQALVERRKVKLTSSVPGLLPAHVYGGVSWGYQDDTGLLRTEEGDPDPAWVARCEFAEESSRPTRSRDAEWILHPFGPGELVIQAAHITSENFRITLGEAVHICGLLQQDGCYERALRLAEGYGFAGAVALVSEASTTILSDVSTLDPRRFPRSLPRARLENCFLERYRHLTRSGGRPTAIIELASSEASLALRRTVRTVRRWRRGHEDRRS
jgi:hypothetical protein